MDVRHYFDSVDFSQLSYSEHSGSKHFIGTAIEKQTKLLTPQNTGKIDIAIIGAPFDSDNQENYQHNAPDNIRKEFYSLSQFDKKINIVDFGNLKKAKTTKGNYHALRDIIEVFNELGIVTVIIGGSKDLSTGVCEAFKSNKLFSLTTVDASLDVKKGREAFSSNNYLSRIFTSMPQIFQFNIIGYQRHLVPAAYFKKTKGISNNINLGRLRNNISLAEPILRNTDFLSFSLGALKHSESPGSNTLLPNGLQNEEACQLARYAGISNNLKTLGIFGYNPGNDKSGITAKLSAEMIWYFIEGFSARDNLNPDENDDCIMYQVEVKYIDDPLIFYKNRETDQWWMQINLPGSKPVFAGCTETEYIQAQNDEIPELWLKYIQKLDELLK